MKSPNTIEQARIDRKDLGEYSGPEIPAQDNRVHLRFVAYTPGARSGKFHHYNYLDVPRPVFEQMQAEKIL